MTQEGNRRKGLRSKELAAATPDSRNRYVDLMRVISIAAVVIGHWMLAVLGWKGGFTGANLLTLDPSLHILTWVFQVMPVFFIVGGFANGGSWESAERNGIGYGEWLRNRAVRLMRPAVVFVAFWTILPAIAVGVGLPSSFARLGGQEVALPLWFLGIYLAMMLFVPVLVIAHRRWGAWTLAVLALAVAAIDIARYGLALREVGAPNFLFVWLGMLELGLCWRDGSLTRRRWLPWAMAGGGLLVLAVLTLAINYPVSMVHLFAAPRSNAMPPTFALFALGVWQCGAMLIFEAVANRWLQRSKAWVGVVVANSVIMTLYLWNMSAVVLAAALLFPTGVFPQPEALGAPWWWLRPAWLLACSTCLVPFVLGFRWAERPSPISSVSPGPTNTIATVSGTALAAAGLGVLAANAFPVVGEPSAVQMSGVAAILASVLLLRLSYGRGDVRT